jgi:hypothetical protein
VTFVLDSVVYWRFSLGMEAWIKTGAVLEEFRAVRIPNFLTTARAASGACALIAGSLVCHVCGPYEHPRGAPETDITPETVLSFRSRIRPLPEAASARMIAPIVDDARAVREMCCHDTFFPGAQPLPAPDSALRTPCTGDDGITRARSGARCGLPVLGVELP